MALELLLICVRSSYQGNMVSPLISRRDAEGLEETAGLLSTEPLELEDADESPSRGEVPAETSSSPSSTGATTTKPSCGPQTPAEVAAGGKGVDMVSLCRICLVRLARDLDLPGFYNSTSYVSTERLV